MSRGVVLSESAARTLGQMIQKYRGQPIEPGEFLPLDEGKHLEFINPDGTRTCYPSFYNGYTDTWRTSTHVVQVRHASSAGRVLALQTGHDASGRKKFVATTASAKGKLDGQLTYQGSATMSIWEPNASGTEVDTGENITVYDWLLSTGESIASGKQVVATYMGGRWYVTGAQC